MNSLQNLINFIGKNNIQFLGLFVSIFSGVLSFYYGKENDKPTEISFSQQIDKLDDVQKSLNTLSTFISEQKIRLQQYEKTLANLQLEQEKLKPVVEADKKVVEALLSIQADKERKNVWQERLIGLFFGIAGSLIASLIYTGFFLKN